jgi:hypothetical protein
VALTEALALRLRGGEPLSRPPPQLVVRHRDLSVLPGSSGLEGKEAGHG